MGSTLALLHDGLRLSLLQRPRRTPLQAGFGSWFAIVLLMLLLRGAVQWFSVEPPRTPNPYGLQSEAAGMVLTLAAMALLCAVAARRALFWPAASWFTAAMLLPNLVAGVVFSVAPGSPQLVIVAWWGVLAWCFLIVLRLALFACQNAWPRALAAAVLATAIVVLPWLWLPQQFVWSTQWFDEDSNEPWVEPGQLEQPEATMYAQSARLRAALQALAPQRPGRVDLYTVAFGGDASEDVFRNEVEHLQQLAETRFDARGRVLALLNHPESAPHRPLATATNLERALRGVAQRMDVEEDVLFLYLTSHGSEEHELYVNQPPLPLDQLDPPRLRAALDDAGIRWRVVVVSACYSGGFIEALRDERTLVITAARADRTSFGCGAESDITWFGDAFLAHALNETTNFRLAYKAAAALVAQWEKREEHTASEPQIDEGAAIGAKLDAWQATLPAAPRVEFKRRD